MIRTRSYLLFVALIAFGLFASGCEEDVAAWEPVEEPFEFYGLLDPSADTQYVRVFPLDERLTEDAPEADAAVVSYDLQTGERIRWRDSLLSFEDGSYGYLYYTLQEVEGGRRHSVEVSRSDQVRSRATVDVPLMPTHTPTGSPPYVRQRIYFGAPGVQMHQVVVQYTVSSYWCGNRLHEFTYDYSNRVGYSGQGQYIDVDLEGDYQRIRSDLFRAGNYWRPRYGAAILSSEVHVHVTAGDWRPPGGVFDPEVLMAPGVMTNVENGYGFVGTGYDVEQGLSLSDEVKEGAGFRTEDVSGGPDNCYVEGTCPTDCSTYPR